MTDAEINIAIVKALGLPGCPPWFTNDLNATAEMEKVLSDSQVIEYNEYLYKITVPVEKLFRKGRSYPADGFLFHATAKQRAEAFLRTINKWKEDAP